MKKSNLIYLIFGIVLLSIFLVFSGINLPFNLALGTLDSDLLTLSGGVAQFSGYNPDVEGEAILASYVVGAGNDITQVGSYDSISTTASGVPADYSNPQYTFIGKKNNLRLVLPLNQGSSSEVFNLVNVSNGSGSILTGYFSDCVAERNTMRDQARAQAKNNDAQYFEFRAKPDIVEIPLSTKRCTGEWIIYKKSGQMYAYTYGSKSIQFEMSFQAITNANNESSTCILSNNASSCFFTSNGTRIGSVRWAGNLTGLDLVPDLTTDKPINYNGVWSNGNSNYVTAYESQLINFNNSYPFYSSPVELPWEATARLNIRDAYALVNNSRSSTIDGKSFVVSGSNFILDGYNNFNPVVSVVLKGSWLGVIRNNPQLDLTCSSSTSGERGSVSSTWVKVTNPSQYTGNYSLAYNCAAGIQNYQSSLAAGANKQYAVNWNNANSGTGNCLFNLSYSGTTKTCSTSFNITEPHEQGCNNNGSCEVNRGETIATCPNDCKLVCPSGQHEQSGICVPDQVCGVNETICGGTCVPSCQAGQTLNSNCQCVSNGGGIDWFWLFLCFGAVIIIGGIVFILARKKKGLRR